MNAFWLRSKTGTSIIEVCNHSCSGHTVRLTTLQSSMVFAGSRCKTSEAVNMPLAAIIELYPYIIHTTARNIRCR